MKLTEEMIEQLKADLSKAKNYEDLMGRDGAIKKLLSQSLEQMLESELAEHLGYEKHSPAGRNTGNSRNGKTHKTLKNDNGEIEITVPRDRNGEFDPVIVKKYERTIGPIEDKIISMYAKGMTTRDIQSHIQEMYGLDISATLVSNITDKIVHIATEWQNRPLEGIYPIFFKYPEEIRTIIYTTNAVEAVHRQFRKVTKARSLFPNDDALKKMLYLAYRDLSKKWTMPIRNWAIVLSNFSINFDERLEPFL